MKLWTTISKRKHDYNFLKILFLHYYHTTRLMYFCSDFWNSLKVCPFRSENKNVFKSKPKMWLYHVIREIVLRDFARNICNTNRFKYSITQKFVNSHKILNSCITFIHWSLKELHHIIFELDNYLAKTEEVIFTLSFWDVFSLKEKPIMCNITIQSIFQKLNFCWVHWYSLYQCMHNFNDNYGINWSHWTGTTFIKRLDPNIVLHQICQIIWIMNTSSLQSRACCWST